MKYQNMGNKTTVSRLMGSLGVLLCSASICFGVESPAIKESGIVKKIEKHFVQGNIQKAKEVWGESHMKYPSSVLFYYWGGKILLHYPERFEIKRKKNLHRAIKNLTEVTKHLETSLLSNRDLKKKYLDAQYHIAIAFFLLNDLDRAIAAMRHVIKQDDQLASAWFNMGIFYELRGKRVDSNNAYKRYLSLLAEEVDEF